jgi:hypothetical protein
MRQAPHRLACWPLRRPPGGRSLAYWKPGPGSPGRAAPGRGRRIVARGPWPPPPGPWAVGRPAVAAWCAIPWRDSWAVAAWCELPALLPGARFLGRGPWPPGLLPGARAARPDARAWDRAACYLVRALVPGPGAGGESRRAIGAGAVRPGPGAAISGPCAMREGLGPISHKQLPPKQFWVLFWVHMFPVKRPCQKYPFPCKMESAKNF